MSDSIAEIVKRLTAATAAVNREAEALKAAMGSLAGAAMAPGPIAVIQETVAVYYGFGRIDLLGRTRTIDLVAARHVAMFLCLQLLKTTLTKIGAAFLRDHGTVMHARSAVLNRQATNAEFASELLILRELCRAALVASNASKP
jgi:chromosomal replication initiation ATPase DnaA